MELVVSSHAVLAHVGLSARWEVERLDVLAQGFHYGTGLHEDGFLTMVREDDLVTRYHNGGPGGRYREVERFSCRGDYDDVHQVALWNGGLLVANTGRNSVDLVRLRPFSSRRHCFGAADHDVNHVNSVFPCGERQVLVLLNNKGARSSEVAVLEWDESRGFEEAGVLPLADMECHNVWSDGECLAYNASRDGAFVVLDLGTGRELCRHRFPGYTKGLAVTGGHFLVGYSDKAVRDQRETSRGYLAVVERETLDLAACVDLNAREKYAVIGNVNEVRCLSEPDKGHGWGTSVALPRTGDR